MAAASLNLSLLDDALSYYTNLSLVGFLSSSYITAQLALAHYHKKGDVFCWFLFDVGDTRGLQIMSVPVDCLVICGEMILRG